MKRYNICMLDKKEDQEKGYWNKVGVVFDSGKGNLSIKLHMFPEWMTAFPADDEKKKTTESKPWDG